MAQNSVSLIEQINGRLEYYRFSLLPDSSPVGDIRWGLRVKGQHSAEAFQVKLNLQLTLAEEPELDGGSLSFLLLDDSRVLIEELLTIRDEKKLQYWANTTVHSNGHYYVSLKVRKPSQ